MTVTKKRSKNTKEPKKYQKRRGKINNKSSKKKNNSPKKRKSKSSKSGKGNNKLVKNNQKGGLPSGRLKPSKHERGHKKMNEYLKKQEEARKARELQDETWNGAKQRDPKKSLTLSDIPPPNFRIYDYKKYFKLTWPLLENFLPNYTKPISRNIERETPLTYSESIRLKKKKNISEHSYSGNHLGFSIFTKNLGLCQVDIQYTDGVEKEYRNKYEHYINIIDPQETYPHLYTLYEYKNDYIKIKELFLKISIDNLANIMDGNKVYNYDTMFIKGNQSEIIPSTFLDIFDYIPLMFLQENNLIVSMTCEYFRKKTQ